MSGPKRHDHCGRRESRWIKSQSYASCALWKESSQYSEMVSTMATCLSKYNKIIKMFSFSVIYRSVCVCVYLFACLYVYVCVHVYFCMCEYILMCLCTSVPMAIAYTGSL